MEAGFRLTNQGRIPSTIRMKTAGAQAGKQLRTRHRVLHHLSAIHGIRMNLPAGGHYKS